MGIYLDNAATTKVCDEAYNAIINAISGDRYGNPSSLHKIGIEAEKIIENARKVIATALGCDVQELYFTSGATESNNIAVQGCSAVYGKRKKKIITTSIEHSSITETMSFMGDKGFEVVKVSPDINGNISSADILNEVDENTFFVSMMLVNNENGYILPVKETFSLIKKRFPEVITHCDAVQGFMKIPFKLKNLGADMVTLSGHKIYAAKGTGALYIKKGLRIQPLIFGGKQERGIRSGTESVPLIAGFGAAVDYLNSNIQERLSHSEQLKNHIVKQLGGNKNIIFNIPEEHCPYIINISVLGLRSEILLHYLENKGIYISSGSACSKGAKSGILKEFGLNDKLIDSAIRISTSYENTESEINKLAEALISAEKNLIHA